MNKLYASPFSPWSERARWALDHHRLPYREIEYTVMLGAPLLRLRLRAWRGKLTIPVFVGDGVVLRDSVDIARHADAAGHRTRLFEPRWRDEIDGWIAVSDRLSEAGRVLLLPRMLRQRAALRESLPGWTPRPLRGAFVPAAWMAAMYVQRKYEAHRVDAAEAERQMRQALDEVRQGLGERRHLVGGRLTFADVAVAAAMQFVRPVAHPSLKLGPASRRAWTNEEIARAYQDLLTWRDGLYRDHR